MVKPNIYAFAQSKTAPGEGQEAPETGKGWNPSAVRFEMHPALKKVIAPD